MEWDGWVDWLVNIVMMAFASACAIFIVGGIASCIMHKPLDPCASVNISAGTLEIKNIQCLSSPDKDVENNVALVTFIDKNNKEERTYTVSNVDGRLIYDVNAQTMLAIQKAKHEKNEALATGIAVGAIAVSGAK